jgi:hypothetical protein
MNKAMHPSREIGRFDNGQSFVAARLRLTLGPSSFSSSRPPRDSLVSSVRCGRVSQFVSAPSLSAHHSPARPWGSRGVVVLGCRVQRMLAYIRTEYLVPAPASDSGLVERAP